MYEVETSCQWKNIVSITMGVPSFSGKGGGGGTMKARGAGGRRRPGEGAGGKVGLQFFVALYMARNEPFPPVPLVLPSILIISPFLSDALYAVTN